ncbi:glycosyltransferase family 2 protein [Alteromonas stellipolaris]|uniref:glycosyltransferase family 2 protein n=1 Tax=Alteromonas stellipolaris TaxID=233316 RepID=UPI001DFA56EB|nr:glycosyltransferase [Alteromonas stellipolaris]MBZ2163630.1 glycosyltransferase [Alteromonas stellipolaris]
MKTRIKKIIKARLPSIAKKFEKQRVLNVDLVCAQNERIIMSGWLVDKQFQITASSLKVKGSDADIHTFERPDVSGAMGLESSQNCFGFIIVIDGNSSDLSNVQFESDSFTFPLSKQRYDLAKNVSDILAHVPNDRDQAFSFFQRLGFDVDEHAVVAPSVARKLDKDVLKIKRILDSINVHDGDFFDVAKSHLLPEIQRIWKSRIAKFRTSEVQVLGKIIDNPTVSIIIPLYGRYDFIQHQISQFSKDSGFSNVEIIYVVDDPEISRIVNITAFGVYQIFGYPFKVVYSDFNRGFSGANNLGVSHARGEKLLLLNSDILPSRSGWLQELAAQHESLDDCGILGATLMYEDDTIQHAGMEFRADSHYPGILMNHHPFKGAPVGLLSLEPVFSVPITTGACMYMNRTLYEEIGGFDPLYVLGDFEDSDLCLKVLDKGLKIYCSSTVRLYHLERLSQNLVDQGDWKFKLTLINGVYQMDKWSSLLEEVV